ncbi:hypothetical protein F4775DRAFT_603246 [Biscogniauxia sp. FL1348]|nr:hypothetical protein F4775DRAFT_603246 [Biscogniauxia sp. FL1348]
MSGPFNLTTSWLAPGFPQLSLTNCSTPVPFFTDLALIVTNNNTEGAPSTSEDFATVLRFLSAAVPENWPYPEPARAVVPRRMVQQDVPGHAAVDRDVERANPHGARGLQRGAVQIKGDPEVSGRGVKLPEFPSPP